MSQDYVIPKGASRRFFPERSVDPVLRNYVEDIFARFDCLKAFSIVSVKRGWFFSKKIRTLCVVYDGLEAYRQANTELVKQLDAYLLHNPGFMDCMSFDWSNTEHRLFVETLMAEIPFTKKELKARAKPVLCTVVAHR